MTLKDLLTADATLFLNQDDFAQSVIYRAKSGLETPLTAVVFESMSMTETSNGIETITRTRNMSFSPHDAAIDSTGLVIIDEVEWSVTPEITTDGVMSNVVLKRFELLEQGRPNLRRR